MGFGTGNYTTFTISITITNNNRIIISRIIWIILTEWLCHGWCCKTLPRQTKPRIIPVSAKTIYLGREVGDHRTNSTYTITARNIMTIPTNIRGRIWPVFVWMIHEWIFPTMIWHSNVLGGNVGGPRTPTTFNIINTNTKLIINSIIIWIAPPNLWKHNGLLCTDAEIN